jgi:exodeoxyribonuclease VIII
MHIMLDLETMGTRPDAPIVAIGAVAFNAMGVTDETFYHVVSLHSAVRSGAVIDPSTVMWWLRQGDSARNALTEAQDEAIELDVALRDFMQFVCAYGDSLKGVWGNGASFDNVLMHESGKRCRVPMWEFWKDKCYRTAKGMYPDVGMNRSGTHHNALDDARSQAEHLIAISAKHGDFL